MAKKEIKISLRPRKCPHSKTCTRRVESEHAEFICNTAEWIYCDWIRDEAEAYKRTPSEWAKVGEE